MPRRAWLGELAYPDCKTVGGAENRALAQEDVLLCVCGALDEHTPRLLPHGTASHQRVPSRILDFMFYEI